MKSALAAVVLCAATLATAADSCPTSAPRAVQERLEPVLRSLASARDGQREWDTTYEQQFARLMRAQDPISREARVAAMSYYLGESHATIIVCRVAQDGAAAVPTLEQYNRCALMPDRRSLTAVHPSILRDRALRIISEGSWKQSCIFE
jgi:hypothetical protein